MSSYVVVRRSVCRLSVVCNVRAPYWDNWNFPQCFYAVGIGHPWPFVKNFTEIVPGETPPSGKLNTKGLAKYSDFGPIERKIGAKLLLITNRNRIWNFYWYQTRWPWITLNGVIALAGAHLPNSVAFGTDCVQWLKIHQYFLQQKCRPQNLVFSDISLIAILAGDHPRESVKVRHSPPASENVTNNRPWLGNGADKSHY